MTRRFPAGIATGKRFFLHPLCGKLIVEPEKVSTISRKLRPQHLELALAFGQELQLERERRSVSMEAIAEATKVPRRHLIALEGEHLDQLPGGIFIKGILRSYCRHLGLNEDEWLERLPGTLPEATSPEWAEFAANISRNRTPTTNPMRWRWWGVLLMGTALGVISWVAWHYAVQPQVRGASASALSTQSVARPALLLHRPGLADYR